MSKQQVEEIVQLVSTLGEIENLKNEFHLSQNKVASLTKRVETSNAYQKLAAKALERLNKENVVLKQWVGELGCKAISLTEKVECVRREAQFVCNDTMKQYMANFHLTNGCPRFAKYWIRFAYIELAKWIDVHSTFDNTELRSEFLDEGQ